MSYTIGIDPGSHGHAVLLDDKGQIVDVQYLSESPRDILNGMREFCALDDVRIYLEEVHSMPRQGVASTFKFGRAFGLVEGIVVASGVPYEYVRPQAWQKALGIKAKSGKAGNYAMAQQLWPHIKWARTDTANMGYYDAALIAEYGRRQR